jgi:hypothetical protein
LEVRLSIIANYMDPENIVSGILTAFARKPLRRHRPRFAIHHRFLLFGCVDNFINTVLLARNSMAVAELYAQFQASITISPADGIKRRQSYSTHC